MSHENFQIRYIGNPSSILLDCDLSICYVQGYRIDLDKSTFSTLHNLMINAGEYCSVAFIVKNSRSNLPWENHSANSIYNHIRIINDALGDFSGLISGEYGKGFRYSGIVRCFETIDDAIG